MCGHAMSGPSTICSECGEEIEVYVRHRSTSFVTLLLNILLILTVGIGVLALISALSPGDPLFGTPTESWTTALRDGLACCGALATGAALWWYRRNWIAHEQYHRRERAEYCNILAVAHAQTGFECHMRSHGGIPGTCDRCGRQIQLALRPVRPSRLTDPRCPEPLGAIILVVAATAHFAVNGFFCAAMFWLARRASGPGQAMQTVSAVRQRYAVFAVIFGAGVLVCCACMYIAYRWRIWIVRRPQRQRRLMAASMSTCIIMLAVVLTVLAYAQ